MDRAHQATALRRECGVGTSKFGGSNDQSNKKSTYPEKRLLGGIDGKCQPVIAVVLRHLGVGARNDKGCVVCVE